MATDDPTPVRKISTTALDLGAVAAGDLLDHLKRLGYVRQVGAELIEIDITEPPPGFISRLASWIARGGRRVADVEKRETDVARSERDEALKQLGSLRSEYDKVCRERNKLAALMQREE